VTRGQESGERTLGSGGPPVPGEEPRAPGPPPSHLRPRTRDGWVAVLLFLGLFLLVEPPLLFLLANRTDPWILGVPFLYAYLFLVYAALIGVLLWALKRRL